jgi:phage shock protein PspC (stress-responsive transcriptional regulator)
MKKCPICAEEIQDEALKCKHCGSWVESPAGQPPPTWGRLSPSAKGSFRRSSRDRMLTGVCGGLAASLGVDPVLVRVIYALATFFTAVIPGIVTYILLSLIVPLEDSNLV